MRCGGSKQKENSLSELRMKNENKEFEIKICLLGQNNVGKTAIANRFCKNNFIYNYPPTIGGQYYEQNITLNNGEKIKLHIWDTNRIPWQSFLYYRDAQAAILIYDASNEKSLESLKAWLKELDDNVEIKNMTCV